MLDTGGRRYSQVEVFVPLGAKRGVAGLGAVTLAGAVHADLGEGIRQTCSTQGQQAQPTPVNCSCILSSPLAFQTPLIFT